MSDREQWVEEQLKILDKKVHKLIEKLGPDEQSVLKEIRKDGIKAIPKATCECLLALWFNIRLAHLNVTTAAHVKSFPSREVKLYASIDVTVHAWNSFRIYKLPIQVAQVMWNFDNMEYPDLVDEVEYKKRFAA